MTTAPTISEDAAFYQALGFSQQRAAEKAEHLHADMARLNAELRESERQRERKAISEYALQPDLFLMKSASVLQLQAIRTRSIDEACTRHATACKAYRRRIAADPTHWTADHARARLAAHRHMLSIARYLRRFGERKRVELMTTREAA